MAKFNIEKQNFKNKILKTGKRETMRSRVIIKRNGTQI
jgi:hypothetical protein